MMWIGLLGFALGSGATMLACGAWMSKEVRRKVATFKRHQAKSEAERCSGLIIGLALGSSE